MPWVVFVQQLQVAHEWQQLVDVWPQRVQSRQYEMLVDQFWLRRMQQRQSQTLLPRLVLDLEVGMRDVQVFAVPDLKSIDFRHFVDDFEMLNFMMSSLVQRLIPALTRLIFETVEYLVNDTVVELWPALVAFGLVIVDLHRGFVPLVAFGDIVVRQVIALVSRRRVFAALPLVAVDDEYILYVEVVGVQFVLELLIFVLQQALHHPDLLLRVYYIKRPFLAAFLLTD